MTIKEAIALVFKLKNQSSLHVNEITEYIKSNIDEYKDQESTDIQKRVNAFLAASVKSKTNKIYKKTINPKTGRPKKGVYSIAPPKKIKSSIRPDKNSQTTLPLFPAQQQPQASSFNETGITANTGKLYFGKAGEFAVVSELLFRGYSASIMSVDEGIDITASKNDKFFFIQVKTTLFADNKISVTIKPNNFVNNTNTNIFYTIVFRYLTNSAYINRYIILSSIDLERLIRKGAISYPNGNVSIKIRMNNGKLEFYNGNITEEVDYYYLDNFDMIK